MELLCRLSFLLFTIGASLVHAACNPLIVSTETGTFIGAINESTPNVRQFLGIPYATPPINALRWLPPTPATTNSSTILEVTKVPLSCAQNVAKVPTVYNQNITQFIIPQVANGSFAALSSEDCLTLAIWTPTGKIGKLPVVLFMTGGGFDGGGIDIGYQLPQHWVQRTQAHVAITINYRLNIMGFPNAAGLSSQNLGILDQRLAVEWVRDNIAAFGGDPDRITLMGQSAGAESVDIHNFAYYQDPIVNGFYMMSGTAGLQGNPDATHTNFTFVASHVGCGGLNATGEIDCMRKVPVETIQDFWSQYADNGTLPGLDFGPIPDEKIIFSNYSQRYAMGAVSKVPAIVSTNAYEGVSLAGPYNLTSGPAMSVAIATTLELVCSAHNTSVLRAQAGLSTYRYQFAGNFSDVSILPWLNAFHGSDIPMVFGSYADFNGPGTPFEEIVSREMQDFVLEFMRNPVTGPKSMSWPEYRSGKLLRFGADGNVLSNVSTTAVDGACFGQGPYDPTP